MKTLILLLLSITTGFAFGQNNSFNCIIEGEVLNRPESKELLLIKEGEDLRISAVSIPIVNGKFNHKFSSSEIESYQLCFKDEFEKGAWRPILFFAEPSVIKFRLYPMDEYFSNEISGGKYNDAYNEFKNTEKRLFDFASIERESKKLQEENNYLSEAGQKLYGQISAASEQHVIDSLNQIIQEYRRDKKFLSKEAMDNEAKARQLYIDMLNWQTDQVKNNINLISYRALLMLLNISQTSYSEPIPISLHELIAVYENEYKKRFPRHPYTVKTELLVNAITTVKKGGKFIDFTAPDFEGNTVKFSEQLKGKIVLLNLWASWCGPCRRHGKEIIPVYEKYKSKGFEVIGVARERDKSAGLKAAEMDEYPWLNLLELNDENKIWQKYGIGNSGGGMFLINSEGIILAVSPTAEELENILKSETDF